MLNRFSRRAALKSISSGFGYLAFAGLAQQSAARDAAPSDSSLATKSTHFPAKAKRVIFLSMNGGPSHVDLFDHKPALGDHEGRKTVESAIAGNQGLMESPFDFAQHGESGLWFSELCPNLAKHADDLCFIHIVVSPNTTCRLSLQSKGCR
ncbi:MAG: DUF1501 domain-containing protein, partial [Fuerstiella sp.]|nr:DUF1501 domain-containing protein [Fuerstiella sp.]